MSLAPCTATNLKLLGCFVEKDTSNYFEYEMADDYQEFLLAGKNREFPHNVWVTAPWDGIDCGYRRALVKETVAYIVVDEDENGPVIEKWYLKNNRKYYTEKPLTPGEQLLERLAS